MRLFISEQDGRCDWLHTTAEHNVVWSIWSGDHSEFTVISHLNRKWKFHAKSHERIDAFFGLSSWLSTRSSTATRRMRSTASWLRDNCTRLSDSLQHTVDVSKFPTLVGQFTQQPSCTIVLWQIERISIRIASSWEISWLCLIFYWYLGIDSFPRYSRYTK